MVPANGESEAHAACVPVFCQLMAGHGVQDVACADDVPPLSVSGQFWVRVVSIAGVHAADQ